MLKTILRTVLGVLVLSLFVAPTAFAAEKADLDSRVQEANTVLKEIMASPDQSIPEEMLAKCRAIAIYPNVLKGGFILGARFGRGVVLTRDQKTGQWGPVAFSTIGGGSWGLQIGAQATDLILVVMNERGMQGLLSNNVTLGADASIAAGPVGRNSEAATDLSMRAGILSYSRSRGLFGGLALDGAVLTQDNASNGVYYGHPITSKEILLSHAVPVGASSKQLVSDLTEYSKRWKARVGKPA